MKNRLTPSLYKPLSSLFAPLLAFGVLAFGLDGLPAPLLAQSPSNRKLLFTEYGKGPNRFVEIGADGNVVWEFRPPSTTVIFQVLSTGNILFGYGGNPTGVREITSRGEMVFDYVSNSHQVFGCERLANGNTLVAEQDPCQAVEVNSKGETVRVTPLSTSVKGFHLQVRNIHQLPNGNILAAHEGEGAVREVDPLGKVVWEYTGVSNTGEALRLTNGNTLICCGTQKRVIEVSPEKAVVWEFKAEDAPELNLTWISSVQLLKNGNLLIGNFLRGQEGKGAHAFEVSRDKRIVWQWADHSFIKSLTTVRALGE
jgi:outer membrane protein assembly factor BamB